MNKRLFIRKKAGFRLHEEACLKALSQLPGVSLSTLSVYNVYDVFDADQEDLEQLASAVVRDPLVDYEADEADVTAEMKTHAFLGVQYLEGQYDQRADAAEQCLRLLRPDTKAGIRSGTLYIFGERPDEAAMAAIRRHLINPVDSCEKDFSRLDYHEDDQAAEPHIFEGFCRLDEAGLADFLKDYALAMSASDLAMIQAYFQKEGRDPNEVEIRVLDTYWSDHCRHTTFNTEITSIKNESRRFAEDLDRMLSRYAELRKLNGREHKPACLMDMATIAARELRRRGRLDSVEISDEINACSVFAEVENKGKQEPWMLMFKNETHNHPTEIEPFGGAGTCLGGAIRDPLSGRAWVYQALRLSGSGDINTPLEDTLPNKLPQRDISRQACRGYSSYGNQIGLATTSVREFYHPGYTAKRLELGAVVAAVPQDRLRRAQPRPGDVIILLGGRTGRDGVGGATGSSKAHTKESLKRSGSEVQKGNPVTERKIQRLFRRPEIGPMIRKCNDFGAGGVAVAVGELADSLDINLDYVPLKYRGLNAVEIAISESQERMACLLDPKDADAFIRAAAAENLEAVILAEVTDSGRLRMFHHGRPVLDLSREFLNLNGAPRSQEVVIRDLPPVKASRSSVSLSELDADTILKHLRCHNHGSQEGMVEQFDASIGRSTVLMPYGGKYQKSEECVSAQTFPAPDGSRTCSLMSYGFSPAMADNSPYLMAAYGVIEALARLTAAGADVTEAWLSCQEYFKRLDTDPEAWGTVVQALLGLLEAQEAFGVAAIGGKDSMSGSFENIHVPPTLVSFAVACTDQDRVISATLPDEELCLFCLPHRPLADGRPDYEALCEQFAFFRELADKHAVLAASAVRAGGLVETLSKMALGNRVPLELAAFEEDPVHTPLGSLVFALSPAQAEALRADADPAASRCQYLGCRSQKVTGIRWNSHCTLSFAELESALEAAYGRVFPLLSQDNSEGENTLPAFASKLTGHEVPTEGAEAGCDKSSEDSLEIRVLLPVFPGTNCEFDTASAFRAAGASPDIHLIRNLSSDMTEEDIQGFIEKLEKADILAFSGGFSFGDEPDGSAKFIVNFLRSAEVKAAVKRFLARDGLMLGICNGFQALLKSGFLPYGDPDKQREDSPTLFHNKSGRHVSRIAATLTASTASPWLSGFELGQIHRFPVSHGEGRLMIKPEEAEELFAKGQVAFQYIGENARPTMEAPWNPNGSAFAIEGLISPDGRILGKMGHPERYRKGLMKNIPGIGEQQIFANAVNYCKEKRGKHNA